MQHDFDLVIKSKTSSLVLSYNPQLRKWEAKDGDKVVARRRNISVLVDHLNGKTAEDAQ